VAVVVAPEPVAAVAARRATGRRDRTMGYGMAARERERASSLVAEVVAVADLGGRRRDALWALFARYYDRVDRARFERDLDAKDEVIVVADAAGEHRLWLRDPAPGKPLAAIIPLDKDFITRIASLLRFHRRLLGRTAGPLPRGWPLTAYRLARLDLMLRAIDLRQNGATYREIATALGRDDAARLSASDWKMSASRSFVVRLVRDGIAMMNGDYRKLLRIR